MQEYLDKIKYFAKRIERDIKLMEVCGTHTQVIAENGVKNLLPKNIKLISGPGCPVCVTSKADIDAVVKLAMSGVSIATYGDMIRVRGSTMSLADAREAGAFVKEIYGVEELFTENRSGQGTRPTQIRNNLSEVRQSCSFRMVGLTLPNIVFFGIGFETTAPMTASIVKRGIKVYSAHKAFMPAMKALLGTGEIKVDGLISPGHVAAIVGSKVFSDLKNKNGRGIPQVITGFEVDDVLLGIEILLRQIVEKRAETENEYIRVVRLQGNQKALRLIDEVFEIRDGDWRGLGNIPKSGFEIREKYADMDAKVIYKDVIARINPSHSTGHGTNEKANQRECDSGCLCSEVIKGNIEPGKCPNFRKKCTPENPQGPCMVSREGACNVAYMEESL